jgi:hypothetical protein
LSNLHLDLLAFPRQLELGNEGLRLGQVDVSLHTQSVEDWPAQRRPDGAVAEPAAVLPTTDFLGISSRWAWHDFQPAHLCGESALWKCLETRLDEHRHRGKELGAGHANGLATRVERELGGTDGSALGLRRRVAGKAGKHHADGVRVDPRSEADGLIGRDVGEPPKLEQGEGTRARCLDHEGLKVRPLDASSEHVVPRNAAGLEKPLYLFEPLSRKEVARAPNFDDARGEERQHVGSLDIERYLRANLLGVHSCGLP